MNVNELKRLSRHQYLKTHLMWRGSFWFVAWFLKIFCTLRQSHGGFCYEISFQVYWCVIFLKLWILFNGKKLHKRKYTPEKWKWDLKNRSEKMCCRKDVDKEKLASERKKRKVVCIETETFFTSEKFIHHGLFV